jgi:hypothetical protein
MYGTSHDITGKAVMFSNQNSENIERNPLLLKDINSSSKQVNCELLFTAEVQVQSQGSLCGIYGGQGVTGAGFSPSTFVFPCQASFHQCSIHLSSLS